MASLNFAISFTCQFSPFPAYFLVWVWNAASTFIYRIYCWRLSFYNDNYPSVVKYIMAILGDATIDKSIFDSSKVCDTTQNCSKVVICIFSSDAHLYILPFLSSSLLFYFYIWPMFLKTDNILRVQYIVIRFGSGFDFSKIDKFM